MPIRRSCGAKTKGGYPTCYPCSEKLKAKKFSQFGRHACRAAEPQFQKTALFATRAAKSA